MKRLSCFIMALALVLGLSQCKKQMSVTPNVAEQISITLNVDNGDGSKADVVDGVVTFKQGDVIHVASHGTLRGTLTHNGTNFTGTISGAENGEHLYFYFLGNKTISGEAGSEYIDIDDQTNELPVISMAASEQYYPAAGHVYSATLSNKCALMKFNVTTPSNSPICITGMKNRVNINFGQYADDEANNGFSYDSHDGGVIKMAGGSGSPAVKWAIVLPQSAVGELENGVYTADNNYQGDRPAIRTIEMGKMYSSNPVALEVSTLNPEGPTYTPLTFEAKVAGATITFTKASSISSIDLYYKLNNNEWEEYTAAITLPSVGDKVSFKGTNTQFAISSSNYSTFFCDKECYVYGNIMSIIDKTNYPTTTTLTATYTFCKLFYKTNNAICSHDTKALILPATTLTSYCYDEMFSGCKKIEKFLELPAMTLQSNCYYQMFKDCIHLTTVPVLPATNLASNCYYGMFYGCTDLTSAPALNATDLASSCYQQMFYNCTSLTSAPELPAENLSNKNSCYRDMFYGCSSLTSAPTLPATTLASNCYYNMFYGCSSLTNAPAINATTLTNNCCYGMFQNCTSLTYVPALTATTLANNCYQQMFQNCTSLVSAPAINATALATSCYYSMFSGCTSLASAPELPIMDLNNKSACYRNMFNGCTSLTKAPELPATTLADNCYYGMFSGCTSLTSVPTLDATTMRGYCYREMFKGCTSLTSAPDLPATALADNCYRAMFYGCTNLETAPDLPASTLESSCYYEMFYGCSKLNSIKCLATNNSASNCTYNWLKSTATTGTFTKASSMESWTTGTSGIPSGWTVIDYNE